TSRRHSGARRHVVLCVLSHPGDNERRRTGRGAGSAVDAGPLHRRRPAARIRDAVFHRGQSADREREVGFALRPPDDCAGHGIGGGWGGAGRPPLGGGGWGPAPPRPPFPSPSLCRGPVPRAPRELDMVAAGKHMPLPVPKPKIAEIEVDKTDGKGAPNSAKAGGIVAGKHVPLPAPKPKIPGVEVKKADGKGRTGSVNSGEDWR